MRDPTRGGVASVLNELAAASGVGVRIDEASIPVRQVAIDHGSPFGADDVVYSLTRAGKRQLKAETEKWTDMAAVVAGILNKKADEI